MPIALLARLLPSVLVALFALGSVAHADGSKAFKLFSSYRCDVTNSTLITFSPEKGFEAKGRKDTGPWLQIRILKKELEVTSPNRSGEIFTDLTRPVSWVGDNLYTSYTPALSLFPASLSLHALRDGKLLFFVSSAYEVPGNGVWQTTTTGTCHRLSP
jgi:hypothetical protein